VEADNKTAVINGGNGSIGRQFYFAIKEHYSMNFSAKPLDTMMQESLEEGGYAVDGGRDLYMEVMDTATGLVWMTAAPVQIEDYEALELEESLVKVGIARAPMDSAAFQYSPGAPGEPVRQRVIDGRLYINVAAPLEQTPPALAGGPIEISVSKAHTIGFAAGRSVAVLSLPEGDFVEVVGEDTADQSLVLPEGGRLKRVDLSQPWVVSLPSPTRTFFWFGESMRSFQGPVALPPTI
jgi:hypothetical protein